MCVGGQVGVLVGEKRDGGGGGGGGWGLNERVSEVGEVWLAGNKVGGLMWRGYGRACARGERRGGRSDGVRGEGGDRREWISCAPRPEPPIPCVCWKRSPSSFRVSSVRVTAPSLCLQWFAVRFGLSARADRIRSKLARSLKCVSAEQKNDRHTWKPSVDARSPKSADAERQDRHKACWHKRVNTEREQRTPTFERFGRSSLPQKTWALRARSEHPISKTSVDARSLKSVALSA